MNLHTQGDHGSFMEILFEKTSTPLSERSSTSMLSALLMLLNLKIVHGVSNSFMDELLVFIMERITAKREQASCNHIGGI